MKTIDSQNIGMDITAKHFPIFVQNAVFDFLGPAFFKPIDLLIDEYNNFRIAALVSNPEVMNKKYELICLRNDEILPSGYWEYVGTAKNTFGEQFYLFMKE